MSARIQDQASPLQFCPKYFRDTVTATEKENRKCRSRVQPPPAVHARQPRCPLVAVARDSQQLRGGVRHGSPVPRPRGGGFRQLQHDAQLAVVKDDVPKGLEDVVEAAAGDEAAQLRKREERDPRSGVVSDIADVMQHTMYVILRSRFRDCMHWKGRSPEKDQRYLWHVIQLKTWRTQHPFCEKWCTTLARTLLTSRSCSLIVSVPGLGLARLTAAGK